MESGMMRRVKAIGRHRQSLRISPQGGARGAAGSAPTGQAALPKLDAH